MSRYNGQAAMELVQQHSGGSISSISYGSQSSLGGYVELDGVNSVPSPNSGGFGNLNTSLTSNIAADFGNSFLESSSQNSVNRALGSATVIPLSQTQSTSQPSSGTLLVADEWSGTSGISRPSSAPQANQSMQQSVQSSTSYGITSTTAGASGLSSSRQTLAHSQQQQSLENGPPNSKSQAGQDVLVKQATDMQADGSDLTHPHGAPGNFHSGGFNYGGSQGLYSGSTGQGIGEKSMLPHTDPGLLGHGQSTQNGMVLQQSQLSVDSRDMSFHGSGFSNNPVSIEEPDILKGVLDNFQKGSSHVGGHGHLESSTNALFQVQGSGHLHAKLQGNQMPVQQMNHSGPFFSPEASFQGIQGSSSTPQPHRNSAHQAQNALYYSHLRNLAAQAAAGNGQRLLNSPTHLSGLSNARTGLISQSGSTSLNSFQTQIQSAKHQLSLNQQPLLQQVRNVQGGNQQQQYHGVRSCPSGQPHNFQPGPIRSVGYRTAEQMYAHLQPKSHNQMIQNFKPGNQSFQLTSTPTSSRRDLSCGAGRSQVNIAAVCSYKLLQFMREQRKRPQEHWYCNLCQVQPGRGFESNMDALPRLQSIQYDSGLLDELLFLDSAQERCFSSAPGSVSVEYSKAVHESVFVDLRVIRYGRLRVSFSSAFKIRSWEFCIQNHEEVVPRVKLMPEVHRLTSLVNEADSENFDHSVENLTKHCNAFTNVAGQLTAKLDASLINDMGFSKRYVRSLQIAEVVNCMEDLIDYDLRHKCGPKASLAAFPTVSKLQVESALRGFSSVSQVIEHVTKRPCYGGQSSNLPSGNLISSSMFPSGQPQASPGITATSLSRVWEPSGARLDSPSARSQVEVGLMQPSINHPVASGHFGNVPSSSSHFQYPNPSHLSPLHGQLPSSPSQPGHQSPSSSSHAHLYQQILRQPGSQQSIQGMLPSPGVNQQTKQQQSLPGTPQSEFNDMHSSMQ